MGSSCFARGNGRHLEIIEDYIEENNSSIDIELAGCRCTGECASGPNIIVDGEIVNDIDETSLISILKKLS
jgi:NADH:ubiquinone oxidoreductase subunit E